MRILLTNDDGVDAPGMEVLRAIAAELSDDVWVVAPDGNQSGAGHRFTFGRELILDEREPRVFAVTGGSPADCVVAGCTHVLGGQPPDVVLSGVNNGQNLGDIVHCSGTVAGAREGALQGAVGVALSQAVNYATGAPIEWDNSRRFGADLLRGLLAEVHGRHTFFNVNFPFCAAEAVSGVRVVPHQRFSRSPFRYYASDNPDRFFIAIPETPLPLDEEADFHQLHHANAVTVTPLRLEVSDDDLAGRLDGSLGQALRG